MTSSSDLSHSIHYISSSSEDSATSTTFKIRLFHDYKRTAWLPNVPSLDHTARWILISTQQSRTYKIQTIDNGETLLLQRGWDLLVAVENLQEGDKLQFQVQGTNKLQLSIYAPPNHPPPMGFSAERIPKLPLRHNVPQVIVNQKTPMTVTVQKAIHKVWNACSIDGPVYVCRLLISPAEGDQLIFNKAYTRLIPREKASVAMRFIDSDIIIPGAIKTYRDGSARMVKEWALYATAHYLTYGEIFVCKIHRGPAVWEFIGCSAGGQ